jgi:glycerophosphoryl diester phosphodiesterase
MKSLLLLLLFSGYGLSGYAQTAWPVFDLQGHRGCRGLMPENTLPALMKALELGVTTLEMDVVVSKDLQVVLSHEPWMSAMICFDSTDYPIQVKREKEYNLYLMTYQEISLFDCGSKGHFNYPRQVRMPVCKPLLKEALQIVERYSKEHKLPPVWYNIEIKSSPETDSKYHPEFHQYADLVLKVIMDNGLASRTIIQSFDNRVLKYIATKSLPVRLALLVENKIGVAANLELLGFQPDIYSPDYQLLTQEDVKLLQGKGIRVVPWTVNSEEDMQRLKSWGIDGLITDFPDIYKGLK